MASRKLTPKATDLRFSDFSHEADLDYLLARLINMLGGGLSRRAGYFGHQACEKYLKAISIQSFRNYLPTHDLNSLADHVMEVDPYFSSAGLRQTLTYFDNYEEVGRYGSAAFKSPMSSEKPGISMRAGHIWTDRSIEALDQFVHRTRGMLSYGPGEYVDDLKAIYEGATNTLLAVTWKGPLPLREVLMAGNRFYRPSDSEPPA